MVQGLISISDLATSSSLLFLPRPASSRYSAHLAALHAIHSNGWSPHDFHENGCRADLPADRWPILDLLSNPPFSG